MAMAVQHSVSFADLPQVRTLPPLGIEEPLQDIFVNEYSTALFECKLVGLGTTLVTWHKDGKEILPSQRIKITKHKQWFRLEIASVSDDDIGVYVILCTDSANQVFSKACLYVRPIASFCNNNGILYMDPILSESIRVLRHLVNLTIEIGERIELEVELATESIEDYQWYKSNSLIRPATRIIILSDQKISTLSILRAQETDTGLYHVVVKTKQGIVSSFADVIVNSNLVNKESLLPTIEEPLPDEVEANEKEEIRLTCKAQIDAHIITQWLKNGAPIKENNKILTEDYGNKYIGLRIIDPKQNDTGEYTVMLRHIVTGHFDSSSCYVTFNAPPTIDLPKIKVLRPLDKIVACFGSKVILKCSFDLRDPKYFYVVWYVGRFRVERTNHRFNVVSNSNEFFLVIKQLEPDMAGLAVCELRRALPSRKSVLVNVTSSNVAIVPPSFFNQELKLKTQQRRRVYYGMGSEQETNESETQNMDVFSDERSNQLLTEEIIAVNDGIIMVMDFCRLEDDGFCFMDVLNQHSEMCYSSLTARDKDDIRVRAKRQNTLKTVVIKWNAPRLNAWYAIDYWLTHGFYLHAGVASMPMFELDHPGVEKVMKLRIRAVKPVRFGGESTVCIVPPPDSPQILPNICELKSMDYFDNYFTKTSEVIGCGAFGSVVLVSNNSGDHYAAKLLKTRTQKKRDYAMREFNMIKRLKHPKLVGLVDAFVARDSFVLVMDYLWGGELFDRIVEEEHIKEVDVVPYVRQACEALQYLHAQKIAHLDVKPENIICLNPNSRQVKLIDFGLARVLDDESITRAIYGTKDYVAPEVLNYERLTLACDMWSLGVVTYMLLSGVMPFAGDTWPQRSTNITRANYNYHESAFKEISDLAKDFVDRLLVLNPARRMNATMALNHQWIVEGPPKGAKAGHMRRARENLKSYLANYRARWQRAGNFLIAAHRLRNQIGHKSSSDKDSKNSPLQIT